MTKIKAIVVDDEDSNRSLIVDLIREQNQNFEIDGEANSVKTAYEAITRLQPEVVFLDIKMPDGNGFELLSMFEEINFEVVFISGFDSYALKAFEFNALDYILKPIEPEKFGVNLKKVQARIERRSFAPEDLKAIVESYDSKELIISRIPIHVGKKVVLLDINDILYIQADNGCTQFKNSKFEKYTSSKQLSDFEFVLENYPNLVRINKSVYINLGYILSYSKGITCSITLTDHTEFEISRRKKKEILELLERRREE
jgi:two-component system LytT family response regulator